MDTQGTYSPTAFPYQKDAGCAPGPIAAQTAGSVCACTPPHPLLKSVLHCTYMLALPECALPVSWYMDAFGSGSSCHPHRTGVLSQPPCSNPELGTTFVDACAAAGKTSTTAAATRANQSVILG